MIVYPLESGQVKPGDSILETFSAALARSRVHLKTNDVVAVSSKIIAISENRIRTVETVNPSNEAKTLAKRSDLNPRFVQAVIDEADWIVGGVRGTLLTVKNGDAVANAGIDRKNAPEKSIVLWPRDSDRSARNLRRHIKKRFGKDVGVVIVDSRVTPLRLGTTGLAIGSAGFKPIEDVRGTRDLSGREVEITRRAIADGIAATAQLVMGEAAERKPFVIVRRGPVHLDGDSSIRGAKLDWSQCLFMSQITKNN